MHGDGGNRIYGLHVITHNRLFAEYEDLDNFQGLVVQGSSRVGFNVPPNTLYVIFEMIFTGQMTQPTVSSTEGQ